jgi:hypothetical protein
MPCPCHRCFHLIDREARVKLAHIAVIILSLLSSISSLPLSKVATLSSIFFLVRCAVRFRPESNSRAGYLAASKPSKKSFALPIAGRCTRLRTKELNNDGRE